MVATSILKFLTKPKETTTDLFNKNLNFYKKKYKEMQEQQANPALTAIKAGETSGKQKPDTIYKFDKPKPFLPSINPKTGGGSQLLDLPKAPEPTYDFPEEELTKFDYNKNLERIKNSVTGTYDIEMRAETNRHIGEILKKTVGPEIIPGIPANAGENITSQGSTAIGIFRIEDSYEQARIREDAREEARILFESDAEMARQSIDTSSTEFMALIHQIARMKVDYELPVREGIDPTIDLIEKDNTPKKKGLFNFEVNLQEPNPEGKGVLDVELRRQQRVDLLKKELQNPDTKELAKIFAASNETFDVIRYISKSASNKYEVPVYGQGKGGFRTFTENFAGGLIDGATLFISTLFKDDPDVVNIEIAGNKFSKDFNPNQKSKISGKVIGTLAGTAVGYGAISRVLHGAMMSTPGLAKMANTYPNLYKYAALPFTEEVIDFTVSKSINKLGSPVDYGIWDFVLGMGIGDLFELNAARKVGFTQGVDDLRIKSMFTENNYRVYRGRNGDISTGEINKALKEMDNIIKKGGGIEELLPVKINDNYDIKTLFSERRYAYLGGSPEGPNTMPVTDLIGENRFTSLKPDDIKNMPRMTVDNLIRDPKRPSKVLDPILRAGQDFEKAADFEQSLSKQFSISKSPILSTSNLNLTEGKLNDITIIDETIFTKPTRAEIVKLKTLIKQKASVPPVTISDTGELIEGYKVYQAYKELGIDDIPILIASDFGKGNGKINNIDNIFKDKADFKEIPPARSNFLEEKNVTGKIVDTTVNTNKYGITAKEVEDYALFGTPAKRRTQTFQDMRDTMIRRMSREDDYFRQMLNKKVLDPDEVKAVMFKVNDLFKKIAALDVRLQTAKPEEVSKIKGFKETFANEITLWSDLSKKSGLASGRSSAAHRMIATLPMDKVYWTKKAQALLGDKFNQEHVYEISRMVDNYIDNPRLDYKAELAYYLADLKPKSFIKKASEFRAIAMLSSLKTHIRNFAGNTMFALAENIKDIPATAYDVLASTITGKRTKSLKGWNQLADQWQGFKKGAEKGWDKVKAKSQGKYVIEDISSKYELPFTPAIKNNLYRKITNVYPIGFLELEDQVFSQAAISKSLSEQSTVGAINDYNKLTKSLKDQVNKADWITGREKALFDNPTPVMIDIAAEDGLYKTFRDSNKTVKFFTNIKKALNEFPGEVAGDIVLPFVKTPANLINRAIAYTPFGFARVLNPLAVAGVEGFKKLDQKEIVETLGRATTGTVIGGIGTWLGYEKVITGKPEEDYTDEAYLRMVGLGGWKFNTSAAMRMIKDIGTGNFKSGTYGPQPGDKLTTYDWLQPIAGSLAFGADIGTMTNTKGGTDATFEIMNSIVDQPLLQGVQRIFDRNAKIGNILSNFIIDTANSFIPAIVKDVRELQDNRLKSRRGDSLLGSVWNVFKMGIPRLTEELDSANSVEDQIDAWGRSMERFQDGANTIWNVIFNGGWSTTFKPDPADKEIIRLHNEGYNTIPPDVSRILNITDLADLTDEQREEFKKNLSPEQDTANITLNAHQFAAWSQTVGYNRKEAIEEMVKSDLYKSLSDRDKSKAFQNIYSEVRSEEKMSFFGIPRDNELANNFIDNLVTVSKAEGKQKVKDLKESDPMLYKQAEDLLKKRIETNKLDLTRLEKSIKNKSLADRERIINTAIKGKSVTEQSKTIQTLISKKIISKVLYKQLITNGVITKELEAQLLKDKRSK